ncbi:regulator [Paenibacillus sp. MZ04-78.2]|uniref:regulator n=1 Tax=Paenibacillus sp. MZ04-78.2 TaxID=2962034 RepID=UPI002814A2EB|nr:regulator [Paenibacillus sp. MZ04-78.2]
MNLDPNVMTECFSDEEKKTIMVYKYPEEECLFCSGKQQLVYFKRFYVCSPCIQSLPVLQVFIEGIERKRANETIKKKITPRRKKSLDRLHQAMKENPKASQKELAEILGFSQAWVSKLIRNHVDS